MRHLQSHEEWDCYRTIMCETWGLRSLHIYEEVDVRKETATWPWGRKEKWRNEEMNVAER